MRPHCRIGETDELGFANFSNSFPEADSASSSSSLKSKTSMFFFIARESIAGRNSRRSEIGIEGSSESESESEREISTTNAIASVIHARMSLYSLFILII